MFLIRLLRWLRSYVVFAARAGGGSVERLLNLCAKNGIVTWDCRRKGELLVGCVSVVGYHQMRPLAHQAGVSMEVQKRRGAGFLLRRYRRRVGGAAAAAVCVLALTISQQFVWLVKVEGYEAVDPQVLEQVLEELGVRRGTAKRSIDPYVIGQKVQLEVNELAWASLNLRGTTAILTVRERTAPPPKIDTKIPANVVASQDGQIKLLRVYDGVTLLHKGDVVREGEIIVSGVRQDRWGVTHMLRANAEVIARCPQSLSVEIPLNQERAELTGRVVRRRYLTVYGVHLPLFLYTELEGDRRQELWEDYPSLFGVQLPVGLRTETSIFYNKFTIKLTEDQALAEAQRQLDRLEQRTWPEGIVSREVHAATENGKLVLTGEYIVEVDIAKQVEIPTLEREKLDKFKPPREGGY